MPSRAKLHAQARREENRAAAAARFEMKARVAEEARLAEQVRVAKYATFSLVFPFELLSLVVL
jgi:hypothetical protein